MLTKSRCYITKRKYEILLTSLLLLMFGNHLLPWAINPFLPIQVIIIGAVIFYKRPFLRVLIIGCLVATITLSICSQLPYFLHTNLRGPLGLIFVAYFVIITCEVFGKLLATGKVSPEIISAALCGFILLCFIGCFIFDIIEVFYPASFSGLGHANLKLQNLLYFSVSNLLTLGLGDILPVTILAKKAVMFIGLAGHFYTVFVTSIIIGKYINQTAGRE